MNRNSDNRGKPIPEGEVRHERVVINLTRAELHTLEAGQQCAGDDTLADFIRRAALLAAAEQATEQE